MEEENKNIEETTETPVEITPTSTEVTQEEVTPIEITAESTAEAPVEFATNEVPQEEVAPVETPVEVPVESVLTETVEENNEETNNNGKPKKPISTVVFVILIIIFFVIGIFLGRTVFGGESKDKKENTGNQTNTETTNTETTNTENTETNTEISNNDIIAMDINDTVVQQLFNTFRYDNEKCFLIGEKLNTSNLARLRITYDTIGQNAISQVSCSNYDGLHKIDDYLMGYCGKEMNDSMSKYYGENNMTEFEKAAKQNVTNRIDENDFKNHYMELFSSSYQYQPESFGWGSDFEPGCQIMKYYENSKDFIAYGGQCGGTCGYGEQNIKNAYKQGNILTIESELQGENDTLINVKYEFIQENGNYKFLKVTESK